MACLRVSFFVKWKLVALCGKPLWEGIPDIPINYLDTWNTHLTFNKRICSSMSSAITMFHRICHQMTPHHRLPHLDLLHTLIWRPPHPIAQNMSEKISCFHSNNFWFVNNRSTNIVHTIKWNSITSTISNICTNTDYIINIWVHASVQYLYCY